MLKAAFALCYPVTPVNAHAALLLPSISTIPISFLSIVVDLGQPATSEVSTLYSCYIHRCCLVIASSSNSSLSLRHLCI